MFANTPNPPYYAVIFSSTRTEGDNGYSIMAEKMWQLAQAKEGFLGVETARSNIGITVSYWRDVASIQKWKTQSEHLLAQEQGKAIWYQSYKVRIAKVEREYEF